MCIGLWNNFVFCKFFLFVWNINDLIREQKGHKLLIFLSIFFLFAFLNSLIWEIRIRFFSIVQQLQYVSLTNTVSRRTYGEIANVYADILKWMKRYMNDISHISGYYLLSAFLRPIAYFRKHKMKVVQTTGR